MGDLAAFHEVFAQTLKALELLGSRSSKLEIADQADADACFVERQLLHVTSVELTFPSASYVNLSITCLARTVRNNEVVGQSVFHAPLIFVHLVHVHGVINRGGGMMNDNSFPSRRIFD